MSSVYQVRRLKKDDIPDIYLLCQGNPTYYEYLKQEPTHENIGSAMTDLPPGMTMEDKYFVGFYDGGRLTAILDLIAGYPGEDTAFIGWFMVRRDLQASGTGSAILTELLSYLKAEKFRYARLGYIKGNRQSEGFWTKNGFLPTGKEMPTDRYTAVVMQKEL